MSRQWIEVVKTTPLPTLVASLGMQAGRLGSFGPCPSCGVERRGSDDKRGACGMASDRRGWDCKRCKVKGDALDLLSLVRFKCRSNDLSKQQWGDLRDWCVQQGWANESDTTSAPAIRSTSSLTERLLGNDRPKRTRPEKGSLMVDPGSTAPNSAKGQGGPFAWRDGMAEECAADLWDTGSPQSDTALEWLREHRKLTDETIKAWGLGCAWIKGSPWLTIPLRDESERVVNIRFRSLPPADKTYRVCTGRPLPLFGSHLLGNDLGRVVVCEGELDVMALWQYGLTNSVVSGTAGSDTMKDEWLDQLEAYDGFVLCYDDDEAGERGAKKFAEKMGMDRCSRAILPHKDAGECLIQGTPVESVYRVLDRATPMFDVGIKRVSEYGDDIERLINNPETLVGRTTGSAKLDACIGGLRPGLLVVSGGTGEGKTTALTWLFWNQAVLGTPVMLTSFEQRPVGTVQKLLRMQLGGDFTKVSVEARATALEELGELPIHILDHYGNIKPEELMQTIRYSVRRLGVKLVMIDHLGFLTDPHGDDKVGQIEAIIRALAITGYSLGVTIALVCHPRGLPQGQKRVTVNDLKGASAIKQDASEVWIIERAPPTGNGKGKRLWPGSWWYLDKVRSEFGVPGSKALLAFGPMSLHYADSWTDTPEGRSGALLANRE